MSIDWKFTSFCFTGYFLAFFTPNAILAMCQVGWGSFRSGWLRPLYYLSLVGAVLMAAVTVPPASNPGAHVDILNFYPKKLKSIPTQDLPVPEEEALIIVGADDPGCITKAADIYHNSTKYVRSGQGYYPAFMARVPPGEETAMLLAQGYAAVMGKGSPS